MTTATYKFNTRYKKLLADTVTPVSIYLRVRDQFANSFLLESSDYHGNENSYSYICCDPISSFKVDGGTIDTILPGGERNVEEVISREDVLNALSNYSKRFKEDKQDFKFINNGLFGYMSYEAVQHFEDIDFDKTKKADYHMPSIQYSLFRYVIVLDHFKNELYVFEHNLADNEASRLDEIVTIINKQSVPSFDFHTEGEVESNFTDEQYLDIVNKGIEHCHLGDVFQIVLSRRFSSKFKGDEFQLYRALRSINPSPYLFYFDYGDFKIFGSSPEAQIVIKNRKATIYPIAGTFRRTGDDAADAKLATRLLDDPKENSEHVMLVDLARNDLSVNSDQVQVEKYKEVQYYSHVIHLVSQVTGQLKKDMEPLKLVASTFPAGTLSGAPKYKAMELIDQYESLQRGYYGGAIGFLGFNGDFNHAIMIRSFLSQNNRIHFQAGAGVVAKSDPDSEVQEVYNKLAALRNAIEVANSLKKD